MTVLTVYVPRPGSVSTIDARSAICGTPRGDRVLIDYEGNRYGSSSMGTYEEKLLHAAGRHVAHYPTVARMLVPAESLIEVGFYDTDGWRLTVTNEADLEKWMNPEAAQVDDGGMGALVDALDLPEPTNEANVQLLDEMELDSRFRAVTEQLLQRGEALNPTTEVGRDLHSVRSAYLVEMKRRGMR